MDYEIAEHKELVPNVHFLKIRAPLIAQKAQAGQFVIVKVDPKGERIPLSLAGWDKDDGTVSIVFLNIGTSTRKLAALGKGATIFSCVGPLGNPSQISKYGTVACMAGCYGIGALLPTAKALKEAGNRVIVVIEARSDYLLFWQAEYEKFCDQVLTSAFDVTGQRQGHAPDVLKDLIAKGEKVDRVYAVGCTFMMKISAEAAKANSVPSRVQLNPIMVDGTGMCGVCRVMLGNQKKFACVDGPEFDGQEVDWENLIKRRSAYIEEELRALSAWECKSYG
ncbi:MAG: sulfide/dihydroorotate dehydrogenase-like FAD/NAD-binding protein [Elusimicrobia bacterium]|nr:sulfide/dihydroorotate dehydrogenase-like FAD/NAD-binding protein [Elusimicrobiota bacterium]